MTINGYIDPFDLEQHVYAKLYDIGITTPHYPIDPFQLIRNERILLQETPFDDINIKGMIVHGPNKSGIIINENRNYYSRRFIAMHELSHYWFHPHEAKRICYDNIILQDESIEWQANNAAAYALMPIDLIETQHDYCDGDISYLCNFFQVSKESMTYRLNELHLKINEPKRGSDSERKYHFFSDIDPALLPLESNWLYGGI